jgi:hypothetical protein
VIRVDHDGRRREETFAPCNQYRLMVEAFADAVLGRGALPFGAEDSIGNLALLDAVRASSESGGRAVPIAPPA